MFCESLKSYSAKPASSRAATTSPSTSPCAAHPRLREFCGGGIVPFGRQICKASRAAKRPHGQTAETTPYQPVSHPRRE
jgi:hypothetical protein